MTNTTNKSEKALGGKTCPFCGNSDSHPGDMDSWWCPHCEREYPTRAFKCANPDCWESVFLQDYCEKHKPKGS